MPPLFHISCALCVVQSYYRLLTSAPRRRPSSAPDYLWTNVLKLPAIQVRWSDADSDNHAPNEHLSIKEYMDGIALTVCALQAVSEINEKD